MTKINPESIEAFLKDLTELTKKHGIVIHGCGCCDSPSLDPVSNYHPQDRRGKYVKTWTTESCGYAYESDRVAGTPEIAWKVIDEEV